MADDQLQPKSPLLLTLGVLTDWLGVLVISLFVVLDKLPATDALPWIVGALAGAAVNKARGAGPGSSTAIALAMAGKLTLGALAKGAGVALLVLSLGCNLLPGLAKTAWDALAPVASGILEDALQGRETSPAFCLPLPEEVQPEDRSVVACAGPTLASVADPAAKALEDLGEDSDGFCEALPTPKKYRGVFAICYAPVDL